MKKDLARPSQSSPRVKRYDKTFSKWNAVKRHQQPHVLNDCFTGPKRRRQLLSKNITIDVSAFLSNWYKKNARKREKQNHTKNEYLFFDVTVFTLTKQFALEDCGERSNFRKFVRSKKKR
uniref:Uncharacterized protein n=1 Tax=Onchocerca volvulus TaxID=6282 RepID=A0A8R1TYP4_ONCVO